VRRNEYCGTLAERHVLIATDPKEQAMPTYVELQQQIKQLQQQAEALKLEERQGVIDRMKEAIAVYDITAAELGLRKERAKSATGQQKRLGKKKKTQGATPAYSDGKGNSWGGRGPRPKWLREALANGAALEEFAKTA
jgi:DNA-binding protein H-NS